VGGAITVESDGQRGATFRLRLPRVEEPVRGEVPARAKTSA
jgi:signal transduction histidine kinase